MKPRAPFLIASLAAIVFFMDGDGNVHTVYSGYSGPATGDEHVRLQALFENTIEEILGDE